MWKKTRVLLEISRPPLWVALPLVFTMGMAYGKHGFADPSFQITYLILIQMLMLSFPVCLFIFGVNDIHDYKSDEINPRKRGMEGIVLPSQYYTLVQKSAFVIATIFCAVSLATANPANILFTMTLLVMSYAYSAWPWRLKTRPPLDVICGGIIGFLAPFALGYSFVDDATKLPLQAYYFTLCVMGFHAFSSIMDYDVDKKSGDRTFAVAYGKRAAALFPAIIFLFNFYFIHVLYVKIFFVLCFFLFVIAFVMPSEKIARYFFLIIYSGSFITLSVWIGQTLMHFK